MTPDEELRQATKIIELVDPWLGVVGVKDTLILEMREMGIARLPDTRPDQYEELYDRFALVIQEAKRREMRNPI